MKFRGVHRGVTVPEGPFADGDFIIWPRRSGGWETVAWEPEPGYRAAGRWVHLDGYDDLTDALRDVVYRYGAGPAALLIGDDPAVCNSEKLTLREFLEVNPDMEPAEVAEILKLAEGETYTGGGGAAAEWTVQAIAGVA